MPGSSKWNALSATNLAPDMCVVVVHVEILATLALCTSPTKDHHGSTMCEGWVCATWWWLLSNLITLNSPGVVQPTLKQVTKTFVAIASTTLSSVNVHASFKLYRTVAVSCGWGFTLAQILGALTLGVDAEQLVKPTMSVTPTEYKHLRDISHPCVKRTRAL